MVLGLLKRAFGHYRRHGFTHTAKIGWKWTLRPKVKKAYHFVFSFWIIRQVCLHISIQRLDKRMASEDSLEDIIETTNSYRGYGLYRTIEAQQLDTELRKAAEFVHKQDPNVVVEIGTFQGGSFYTWSRFLDANLIISIDLPDSPVDPEFLSTIETEAELKFIQGDSHDETTRHSLERILDGRQIDFLFIDGDHSYEGVTQDFELYSDLVSEDGLIAFDDIESSKEGGNNGVPQIWSEVTNRYETMEIVDRGYSSSDDQIIKANQAINGHGIGFITNFNKNA